MTGRSQHGATCEARIYARPLALGGLRSSGELSFDYIDTKLGLVQRGDYRVRDFSNLHPTGRLFSGPSEEKRETEATLHVYEELSEVAAGRCTVCSAAIRLCLTSHEVQ